MAELSTLARPYARAAFEVATDRGELGQWSEQLRTAAAVSCDVTVAAILASPSYTAQEMADTVSQVCGDTLNADGRNFLQVLATNKRLPLLPQIWELFEQYKANRERSVDVQVVSAFPLEQGSEESLSQVLSRKLEREVKVETSIDQSLLGGVLIRADDLVIDGSVRGRLNKLAEAMNT